jgi:hypothetical protein
LRQLKADVVAEHRSAGGIRLRIKVATGEELGVELSPVKAAALRDALISAPIDGPAPLTASTASDAGAASEQKGKKALFGRKRS